MAEALRPPDPPTLAEPPERLGHWQIQARLSPPGSWPAVYAVQGPASALLLWWPAPVPGPVQLKPGHALSPWVPSVLHTETLPTGQAWLLALPAEAVLLSSLQALAAPHWLALGDWLSEALHQLQQRAWVYGSDSLAHLLVCPLQRQVCFLQLQAVLPQGPELSAARQALQASPEDCLPAPLPGARHSGLHAWVLGRVLQAAAQSPASGTASGPEANAAPGAASDGFLLPPAPAAPQVSPWARLPALLATLPGARPADAALSDWWQAHRHRLLPGPGWLYAAPAADCLPLQMPIWHPSDAQGHLLLLARGDTQLTRQAVLLLGAQCQWLMLQSAPTLNSLAEWQTLLHKALQYLQLELLKICQRNAYTLQLELSLALVWPDRLLGARLGEIQLAAVPCSAQLPRQAPAGPPLTESPVPAEQPGAVCWPLRAGDLVSLQRADGAGLPGLFTPLPATDALRWVQLSGR